MSNPREEHLDLQRSRSQSFTGSSNAGSDHEHEQLPMLSSAERHDNMDTDEDVELGLDVVQHRHSGKSKSKQGRKVFGGARHSSSSQEQQRGVTDVAFDLAASTLHPSPLLMPHVMQLCGLSLGIPALLVIALLSCFSHGVFAVCLRYTGGSTLNALAANVLPRAWGGQFASEVLVDLGVVFVSLGRAAVLISCISSLVVSLAKAILPEFDFLQSSAWVIVILGTLYAIPPFLFPRMARQWSTRRIDTFQSASILFYVFALFIILVRANKIDWPDQSASPHLTLPQGKEVMGTSPWGGIAILIFSFSSHQSTFTFQRSLRPPKSLYQPGHQHRNAFTRQFHAPRYSWELTAFFGLLGSAVISLGWGLVGYLAIPAPPKHSINIFNAIPEGDAWFDTARFMVLVTMLCGLGPIVRPASTATNRLLKWPKRFWRQQEERRQQRVSRAESSDEESESDEAETDVSPASQFSSPTRARLNRVRLLQRTSILIAWLMVVALALAFGRKSVLLSSMVEIIGCVGSSTSAFLLPAICFIVLFHIRKPRTITGITAQPRMTPLDPDGDADEQDTGVDEMLVKKEQQLQRQLSGRRIWQDVGVFGLLVPVGFVIVFRGITAAVSS